MLTRKEFNRRCREFDGNLADELEELESDLEQRTKNGVGERDLDYLRVRIRDIEQRLDYTYEDYQADEGDARYHAMRDEGGKL